MTSSTHIVILCSRLDLPGGIERAVVATGNLLAENGHRVTLLVLDKTIDSFYAISPKVSVLGEPLNFGINSASNFLMRKVELLQHIRQLGKRLAQLSPQYVISSEYPFAIAAYFSVSGKRSKVFAWEHHHFFHLKKSRFWQVLFRLVYPKLDGVICLNNTEGKLFGDIGCRVVVIPNFIRKNKAVSLQSRTLLTVGWLTKLKGIDLIPAIAQKIFTQFPGWKWVVIGKGEEEGWLKESIEALNLQDKLLLVPPVSADLEPIYMEASIYVMTSQLECFPMVLLEAMSFGIPTVAYDCPTGPSAIVRHNEDGLLVWPRTVDAMATSITELIRDESKRTTFGANAYCSIERFSPEKIYALWKQLFQNG